MAGWVKLHREFLRWEWFHVAEMVKFFIYLLLTANIEDKNWQGITIKRGQLVTSNARLCKELGLSPQTVRTFIKRLILTSEITYKSTNKYVLVTICKYELYQSYQEGTNEQNNEQLNNQLTSNQRTTNEQLTTTKEYKNIRIKEKKNISTNVDGEMPYKDIIDSWNSICTRLPKVSKLTDARKNKIKARIKEFDSTSDIMVFVQSLFESVEASDFLCGINNHSWHATFDWLFDNSSNWVKVNEGNYQNNTYTSAEKSANLGPSERIENGRRTYGSGRATIPMDAPARPTEQHTWDAGTLTWIII